jgi:transposase-like protein
MEFGEALMKVVVKVGDVVALAKRFRTDPAGAAKELAEQMRSAATHTLQQVLDAEVELHLAEEADPDNKRNGYRSRTFGFKGLGTVTVRVPRDRKATFESHIVPPGRRYDEATERDLALLHMAGISTRMLSILSKRVLGVKVSAQEVTNSLEQIVPQAKAFLSRPLGDRRWVYLYCDGTFFSVRRSTTDKEPTLVVLGVDENGFKSVLAAIQGDKDSKAAWAMVFHDLKQRGLDGAQVKLGIMDGLPGLAALFREEFVQAKVGRCWVHKWRNVGPRVPKRLQATFVEDWDRMQYAAGRAEAAAAFEALKKRWSKECEDAVACIERDLEELLAHYDFPKEHWDALRTTNPIERVNKEFKRRSKAMEQMGPKGLQVLLAFTAFKLEFGWMQSSIAASNHQHLVYRKRRKERMDELTRRLLN